MPATTVNPSTTANPSTSPSPSTTTTTSTTTSLSPTTTTTTTTSVTPSTTSPEPLINKLRKELIKKCQQLKNLKGEVDDANSSNATLKAEYAPYNYIYTLLDKTTNPTQEQIDDARKNLQDYYNLSRNRWLIILAANGPNSPLTEGARVQVDKYEKYLSMIDEDNIATTINWIANDRQDYEDQINVNNGIINGLNNDIKEKKEEIFNLVQDITSELLNEEIKLDRELFDNPSVQDTLIRQALADAANLNQVQNPCN